MKPIVIAGIAGLSIAVLGGLAFAATSSPKKLPEDDDKPEPEPVEKDEELAAKALAVITEANADRCTSYGIAVAPSNAAIGSALVRTGQFLADIKTTAADVQAAIVGAIKTGDSDKVLIVAAKLQSIGWGQLGLDTAGVAYLMRWLKQGAPVSGKPDNLLSDADLNEKKKIEEKNDEKKKADENKTEGIPSALADRIAKVLKSQDVTAIRALAKELKAQYPDVAMSLEAAALKLEAEALKKGEVTPEPKPPTPIVVDKEAEKAQARKLLAGKVALAMRSATKNKATGKMEPQSAADLLATYQQAEGLTRVDGSYGTESALSLAETYAIVPPKPLYLGKKGGSYKDYVLDANQYNARINALAAADPVRAVEWNQAKVKVS